MNKTTVKDFEIIPNPDFIHRKEVEEAIKENDTPRPIDYVSSLHLKLANKEVMEETSKAQESGFGDDRKRFQNQART